VCYASPTMSRRFTIVGIGEALYDIFPDGDRLGGAPLNAAVIADQLARPHGGRGVVVSRVGQDPLGERLLAELADRGMTIDFIETDPDRATGRVYIRFGPDGEPRFDIPDVSAWDNLWFDPDWEDLAMTCDGVCFGTLAQRNAQSRNEIYRFLNTARTATRLLDVNLRNFNGTDFYDQRVVERSLDLATMAKLSEGELVTVTELLGLDDDPGGGDRTGVLADTLRRRFELDLVVVSRGERGTAAYTASGLVEGDPATTAANGDADPVGAGDAVSAAILVGQAMRLPLEQTLTLANRVGAFVASQPGATPEVPEDILAIPT